MQKLWDSPSLLVLRKIAVLTRETDSLSEAEDMNATVMRTDKLVDIKKDSPCGVV